LAAKRTHELIPLCHPLPISAVDVKIAPDRTLPGVTVLATVKTTGRTGVEMEALTAACVACLTVYDMVKSVERGVRIEAVRLIEKRGGKSGLYRAAASSKPVASRIGVPAKRAPRTLDRKRSGAP
jgi:cyclic pyranopterin monophosphate synthase